MQNLRPIPLGANMSFTKNGTFLCPGCGAKTVIECSDSGLLFATIELVINDREEEASPKGELRPERLPERIDAEAKGRG